MGIIYINQETLFASTFLIKKTMAGDIAIMQETALALSGMFTGLLV